MSPTLIQLVGTILFAMAVLHTFLVKKFADFSHRFAKGSTLEILFHFLAEIEVVFGLWAAILLIVMSILLGSEEMIRYQAGLHLVEPLFVFGVMVVSSTRPVLWLAQKAIQGVSKLLQNLTGISPQVLDVFVLMVIGPLAGSFITEPAAMTVTALLLVRMLRQTESSLMYFLLAVLFVNVSIGGALTHFAAPPILMVAAKWNWGLVDVFVMFGEKAILAVVINALILAFYFRKKIKTQLAPLSSVASQNRMPIFLVVLHLVFLIALVLTAHHPHLMIGILLFFLGLATATPQFQEKLRLKESLLVAFFLGGIIVFGPLQAWWLTPLLKSLDSGVLYLGATLLTAFTDNAALTFLGSQVEGLSDQSKYYLVAGAISGGGLTIIANAPNAAGFSVLQTKFQHGFAPLKFFAVALVPTSVVCVLFYLF